MSNKNEGARSTVKNTVKIFLRRPLDERNVNAKVVGINGKMYTVPYEKEVEVPKAVAEVVNMSLGAQQKADELICALAGNITEL